jgi:hypothetical protein
MLRPLRKGAHLELADKHYAGTTAERWTFWGKKTGRGRHHLAAVSFAARSTPGAEVVLSPYSLHAGGIDLESIFELFTGNVDAVLDGPDRNLQLLGNFEILVADVVHHERRAVVS